MKTVAFFLCFLIFGSGAFAQAQHTIKGRVTDAATLDPVAFANVYFKGTTIGTTTDFEGFYKLTVDELKDSLTVSSVGYESMTKAIDISTEKDLSFRLTPSLIGLQEVVILPGENPAITLLRKVWEVKDERNIANLEAYNYNSYVKTHVYLRRLLNRKTPRDTTSASTFNRFAIEADKSSMPALPVYTSETFSSIYALRFPKREKVVIKASNTNSLADVETAMLTQLIQKNTMYNFNNNYVRILDKNFVSPIATTGQFYYKYYLMDSLFIDDMHCYEIHVVPRRKEDLAFKGTIWIHDTTYALKRVSVEIGKQANLNFVERIRIQQDLLPDTSDVWYPALTRITADAINIFISAYINNNSFNISQRHPLSFYDTELEVADTAYMTREDSWQQIRPLLPEESDMRVQKNIDSLKRIPHVRLLTALVNMSIKGYVNLGKIELGPYLLLYSNNDVEGHRFRLGYRTNSDFSKKWLSKGYLAYGTRDEKFKYNMQLERFLSRKNWTKVGIQYAEDVENLGAIDEFYSSSAFLSFASSFGGADKLNAIKVGRLWLETDLFRGFTQKIVFKNKTYSPLSPDYHFAYYTDNQRTEIRSDINVSEINFTSFYQPRATFIVDKNERFPVAINKAPAFTFNYSLGVSDVLNSHFSYHKATLGIRQNILLGSVGTLNYDLNISKCFTPLPYPLLTIFPANESVFRTERSFNLMRYGEFIADESVTLHTTFRQDGFILDKIPLIKRLRLRSVATASIAYGNFNYDKNGFYDESNNPDGLLPKYLEDGTAVTPFKTLNPDKPYIEVSYGIENIASVFRVDAIHRLSYLESRENGDKPDKFGIKVSAVFRF